jgi:hypothetical protein
MDLAIGFGLAILAGTIIALLLAKGEPDEHPLPWDIAEMTRIQSNLMATLGAVSITGLVLLVALLSRGSAVAWERMDTAVLMLSLAFGYFVQSVYTLSYLPGRAAVGERLHRLCFALATTLQWRTVVLLSYALTLISNLFGLPTTASILTYLVPVMIASVSIIIAAVSDVLGFVRFGECLLLLLAGLALAGLCAFALVRLERDLTQPIIVASLCYAAVSGSTYFAAGIVPLAQRRPGLRGALENNARRLTMVDMLATGLSMTLLWLALAGMI